MAFDLTTLPPEMIALLEPDLPTLKERVFFHSLRMELDRASRYSFMVSLLLFRILPLSSESSESRGKLREFAGLLNRALRTTDTMGLLRNSILGVIVPHSNQQAAPRLLLRLETESMLAAFKQRANCEVLTSFSRYPTDATTLATLVSQAFIRLEPG